VCGGQTGSLLFLPAATGPPLQAATQRDGYTNMYTQGSNHIPVCQDVTQSEKYLDCLLGASKMVFYTWQSTRAVISGRWLGQTNGSANS